MSRNLNRVWIHLIWSVKYRNPLIAEKAMTEMRNYIRNHFEDEKIEISCANGFKDHLHVLCRIDLNVAISKAVKDIKGATSHWLSNNDQISESFSWQRGYAAYSVSPNDVSRIQKYIENQQDHHEKPQNQYDSTPYH